VLNACWPENPVVGPEVDEELKEVLILFLDQLSGLCNS
jgi:hypothetical protein